MNVCILLKVFLKIPKRRVLVKAHCIIRLITALPAHTNCKPYKVRLPTICFNDAPMQGRTIV